MQVEANTQTSPTPALAFANWNDIMKRAVFQQRLRCAIHLKSFNFSILHLCILVASFILLCPNLVAQTGNVVISTNTSWATGTYNLTSLSVMNGAVLTIGGGSTVTVSGAVLVTANSNVVLQSINNAAQVNGSWQGAGVTLNAGSVQVDAGSSINADGQGYLASVGPGGAPVGSSAGGSYGGIGGLGFGSAAAAPIYGSNTSPVDLGSGGGSRCCNAIPGNGGGAIRLIVSGTLTDNGVISANGGNLVGYQGGGGSGGSVWVTTAGLTGSGVFSATGGTGGEAAGGGGRIAVYYNGTGSTFTGFSASTAVGGGCGSQCANGTNSAGATGTVAFFDTSATNINLMVDQAFTIPANTTVTYDSITVQPGAVLTIGGGSAVTVSNSLTVNGTVVAQSINNAAQVNGSWQGSGVTLHAGSVVVNAGGSIDAGGQGYLAGAGPGGAPTGSSAGGSYGGLGGASLGVSPAGTYGSPTAPTDLGSGGNTRCCGTIPGAGGGALTITVSGTLTDNGTISANGGNGNGLQAGGGSGGTVSIQTATLTGSGSVTASGGIGGEAGGGGGRIALYFNTNNGFDLTLVTSNGGASSNGGPGAIGTVYTLGAGSNLTVSNNTTLPANGNLNFNSVTVNNGSTLMLGSGTTLASNTVTVTGGGNMIVGGGSTLNVSGAVLVTGNSNIVLQSINIAAQVNGAWQGLGVTLNAGSVQVDPGSSINANGQGYAASAGPGGAPVGSSAGGSYGGLGGSGAGGVPAAPIYGSNTTPTDLGSGGGSRCCNATPGAGGGAIRLVVSGTLTNNGVISSNGGNLVGYQGGGGSGGSVWVTTAGLAGSGVFTANGGTGGEAAGGGGRVAVYYNGPASSFTGFQTSTSNGGSCGSQCANGTASAGSTGTAAFFDTSATGTNLMVNQNLTIPARTTVNYNSITVQPGAVLTIGGGSTITVTNLLTVSGTVVAQSINNSALVNNTWQGSGVHITAASVVVNAGGSLNADAQGYVAGAGPGGSPNGSSAGGSYGGLGGASLGVSPAGVYGSTTVPVDLGSGGNTRCCGTIPGQGGGALFLTVSGTLTDNGVISANGGNGVGLQVGGGSGGTVSIQTSTLAGSGSVTASGGIGGEAGGGGGRIALYFNTNNGFDLTLVTSNGGASSNGNPGAVGTVYALGAGANLTVSNNTVLPADATLSYNTITVNHAGTFTLGSGTTLGSNTITVAGGGTLTVGGGSTLNVTGAVLVTGNSKIVLQSINNTAQVNSSWQGAGVTVNAGSVQVDPGSSINADGQGYVESAGPGGAPAGSSAGGSYGGLGGSGSGGVPAGPIYGSNTTPTDLGSGGGSRCCNAIAGPGGGAIRLIVSGTLTDNGVISANGANLIGYQGGGGSGGSVWVTTAGLVGSGVFLANGGTGGEAAGGGGRIAVYYNGPTSSFTGFQTSTSNGGSCGSQCANGTASAGSTGTAGFFDTSATNSNLMVDQDLTIPAGTAVTYNSITVQPGAVLTIGGGSTVTVVNLLTVSGTVIAQSINNSVLINNTWQGTGVTINAASIVVNPNGSITADGQGYVASAGPGGALSGSSTGGSYGGLGGLGLGASPSAVYGSPTAPIDLGSGGALRCCATSAGAGGGALTFNVSGAFTNNGNVSANGGPVIGYQAGGGSGGSVYVKTAALSGSGAFTANGGIGGEAAGAGGRVAVYYDAPSSTFTGFTASTATGGTCGANGTSSCANGTSSNGANGTSAFFDTSATNNNLAIYQNFTIPAGTSPTYNTIAVQNAALLTIGGGATVTVTNALTVSGTVLAQSANNTTQVGGVWSGSGVAINAGSITVNANGSLNADAQGYIAGAGPGGAPSGSSAGGSYGGLGGAGNGVPPAGTYGSVNAPIDLGSGGNTRCCGTIPGPGGGALLLTVTGTLTDNGVISSNGGNGTGLQVGGGSGGSVNLHAANLTGSGTIAVNGGSGGEAGGGGGRIDLCVAANNSFNLAQATSTGGSSSSGNAGSPGTVSTKCGAGPGPVAGTTVSVIASPAVVDQGSPVTFTGIVVPAATTTVVPTGTLTFVDGQTLLASLPLVQGSVAFSTSTLAAGAHIVTVTYSGDATFQPSSFTFTQVIRAIPSISWATPAGIPYGTPLSPTQLNATAFSPAAPNGLPGTFVYQPAVGTVLNAGQQTLTVVFTPSDLVNFAPATKSVSILVGQATPTIAWSPAVFSIPYGTPLGAQQLNATARGVGGVAVTGTFVYTPAAGTVLTAGTQTLSVVFTPSGTNYTTATSTTTITVTQVTPTLTWPTPANLAYGIPLSATQLNATATGINTTVLPGTFVYNPAAGAVLNPGVQRLSVTFSPSDLVDYTTASTTVTLTITDLILTSVAPNTALVGDPAKTITLTGAGFIATTSVMVNGTAIATTYVSPTTLTAVVPAANFTAAAVLQITLKNPSTGSTSASQPLTVTAPALAATYTGPTASQPGTQPVVTLNLSAPYPLPLTATFTLTQKSALPSGVVDPAVQFATGGTTYTTIIPAGSTAIPPIQVQSGTVAGTITIPVVLTANGINVTPANLAPVTIIVPAAMPVLSTASLVRGGTQLSVSVIGFSNTREIVQANFHFTPVAGATLTTTDITAPVGPAFATWFADPSSVAFGSAFTYTQNFTVSDDAANIASVQVTLTNSAGQSTTQTAQ